MCCPASSGLPKPKVNKGGEGRPSRSWVRVEAQRRGGVSHTRRFLALDAPDQIAVAIGEAEGGEAVPEVGSRLREGGEDPFPAHPGFGEGLVPGGDVGDPEDAEALVADVIVVSVVDLGEP